MLTVSPERREELIRDYWHAVRTRLLKHHHRSEDQADLGIGRYRRVMEERQVGDLVYHEGVERTAEAINHIIQTGLPGAL